MASETVHGVSMRRVPSIYLAAVVLLAPFGATAGGALDRFERAHTSPSPSPRLSGDDDDDDDDDAVITWDDGSSILDAGDDDEDDDDEDDDEYEPSAGSRVGVMTLCMFLVPAQFGCFHRAHHVSAKPYHRGGLYVHPLEDPSEVTPAVFSSQTYTEEDWDRWRWFELEVTGFRAMNEADILTHDITGRLWLGPVFLRASWERFYERIPETGQFDVLDLFRFHLDANLLGPYLDWIEFYGGIGASILRGQQVTPAFDVDLDMRVYPVDPFTFRAATTFSIYEIGPVLADSRFQLGVAIDRFEVRAGPRWLYQGEAQGFWGPSASMAVRF